MNVSYLGNTKSVWGISLKSILIHNNAHTIHSHKEVWVLAEVDWRPSRAVGGLLIYRHSGGAPGAVVPLLGLGLANFLDRKFTICSFQQTALASCCVLPALTICSFQQTALASCFKDVRRSEAEVRSPWAHLSMSLRLQVSDRPCRIWGLLI